MNRIRTMRIIVGLCCVAGAIGFFLRSNYLLGGLLCAAGIVMFVFAYVMKT